MKKIVLYDDDYETDQTGYHMSWEYFRKLLEELLWEIIKPENPAGKEKDQNSQTSTNYTMTKL